MKRYVTDWTVLINQSFSLASMSITGPALEPWTNPFSTGATLPKTVLHTARKTETHLLCHRTEELQNWWICSASEKLQSRRHMLYLFSSLFFVTIVTVHWDLPSFFPHLCLPDVSFDQRLFYNTDTCPLLTPASQPIFIFPSESCVKPNLGCSQVRKHKMWKRQALRRPREAWCSSKKSFCIINIDH